MAAPAPPASTFATAPRTEPATVGNFSAQLPNATRLNATRLRNKLRRRATGPGHAGDRATAANPLEHLGTLAVQGSTTCLRHCTTVRSTRTAPKGVAANHVMPLDAATQHFPWSEPRTCKPPQTATGPHSVCASHNARNTPPPNRRSAVHPAPARANPREGAPMALPPELRSLINSANQHRRWAHCPDRTAATAPAREGFERRFEREVDPNGELDPAERAKRAANARQAYFKDLAAKSAKARAARKNGR